MKRKGKPTAEERLQAGLKKLDRAMKELSTRDKSAEDYIAKTKSLVKKYYEKYGEGDLTKINGNLMNELLIETYDNPWTLKNYIHALHYTQEKVVEAGTYKRSLDLVNKKDALKFCKEHDIVRRAGDSTVRKATREEIFATVDELENSRSPYKHQAQKALKLAWATAVRAEGSLEMQGKDIEFNKDGTADVYVKEKGGLPRWTKVYHPEKVDYLREVKSSLKNDNQTIVEPVRYTRGGRQGQIMKTDAAARKLSTVITKSAERIGLADSNDKNFRNLNLHSGRKCALEEEVDWLKQYSREELKEELDRRIEEQKVRQSKVTNYRYTDIEKKYEEAVRRVNWVQMPSKNNPEGIRRTKKDRDLTDHELRLFLTSLDAGHFRVDVLRYYLK